MNNNTDPSTNISTSQSFDSLDGWLDYFDTLHNKTIDLGLERIGIVAERGSLKQLPGKVILIAGTNGKGTTSRFLEACLLAQGFTTGVFNSPHILHYSECVRINGQILDDPSHIQAFEKIEQLRGDIPLTPFEFSTLAALLIFKQSQLDFAIVEVGMGGRGDSTNIVEPDISVITTVDIDHQAFLGDDREAIGYEKAGVMRHKKPVVVGEYRVPLRMRQYAEQIAADASYINDDYGFSEHLQSWSFHGAGWRFDDLPKANIPTQNAATGLMVLARLSVFPKREVLDEILSALVVEGRFERVSEQPEIIVDVAHNVEAAGYLAGRLKLLKDTRVKNVIAVAGMLKDKDIDGTLAQVSPYIDSWHLATLPTARGADCQTLADALEKRCRRPYSCYQNIEQALAAAKQNCGPADLIIVFGSFVTVAQMKSLQGKQS